MVASVELHNFSTGFWCQSRCNLYDKGDTIEASIVGQG